MAENEEGKNVIITIGANTSGVDEGMAKAGATVEKFTGNAEKQMNTLNKIKVNPAVTIQDKISAPLKKIGSGLDNLKSKASSVFGLLSNPMAIIGVAASAFGLFALTKGAADYGNSLYEMAAKMHMSTQQAADMNKVLTLSGTSSTLFTSTMIRLDKAVDTAGKSGNATTKGLAQFGVALKDASGKTLSYNDQLANLAKGYAAATAAGKDQDFVAQVLGMRGQQMIPLLKDYTENAKIASKVQAIGIDPIQAHELTQNMKALQMQTQQLGYGFADAFLPFVNAIAPELLKIMGKIVSFIKQYEPQIQAFFEGVGKTAAKGLDQAATAFFNFVNQLTNNPAFQNASLGGKLTMIADDALDALNAWVSGPGGSRIISLFTQLAEIAIKAWGKALVLTVGDAFKDLLHGNIGGTVVTGGLFYMLGGGMLVKLIVAAINAAKGMIAPAAEAAAPEAVAGTEAVVGTEAVAGTSMGMAFVAVLANPFVWGPAAAALAYAIIRYTNVGKPAQTAGSWASQEVFKLQHGGLSSDQYDKQQYQNTYKAKTGHLPTSGAYSGPAVVSPLDQAKASLKSLPGKLIGTEMSTLPEQIGYIVRQSVTKLRDLPGEFASWFTQAKNKAVAAIAALAGEAGSWLEQTKNVAVNWLTQIAADFDTWFQNAKNRAVAWVAALPGEIATWILTIPNRIASAIGQVVLAFEGFGKSMVGGLVAGFDKAKGTLGAAGQWVVGQAEGIIGGTESGYQAGVTAVAPTPKKHATGGIFSTPHLGLVAEAGPEAIIPLSRSSNSFSLFQQAGQRLGLGGGNGSSGHVINIYMDGALQAQVNGTGDLDEMAEQVATITAQKFREAIANLAA